MRNVSHDNRIPLKAVVDQGYCVGCGACAYKLGTAMNINRYGEYVPDLDFLSPEQLTDAGIEALCPSLHPELNEDVLARESLPPGLPFDRSIGYHLANYAGYVKEAGYRERGTSGGMGTWVAAQLLDKGLIDGVIHAKAQTRDSLRSPFYAYELSTTMEQVRDGAKTRYHVVEISKILKMLEQKSGRYLFIGVPCMVKAIRRLQHQDETLREKLPFVFSLICGHLKSINWSLSLAWGAEVQPEQSRTIQYRTKGEGISARRYVYRVSADDGTTVQKDSAQVPGGRFNSGAMMLPACDYCDDIVGETADLTIGDAWLPRFDADEQGTNMLVVRNQVINDLLQQAREQDQIMLTTLTVEEAALAQAGGLRQRREGLSYRLLKAQKQGIWCPTKRVKPGEFTVNRARRRIYDLRTEVSIKSREVFVKALEQGDFSLYAREMDSLVRKSRRAEIRGSFFRLAFNKLKRAFIKFGMLPKSASA